MKPSDPSTPASDESPKKPIERNDGPWWLYPVALLLAIAMVVLFANRTHVPPGAPDQPLVEWTPSAAPQGETVSLTVDFGNGAKREFAALAWREGMTVSGLMQAARDFHPGVMYTQEGEDEAAFLSSLEGVQNGGANRRNWLYQVNDEHAHVSFAVYKLQPGDKVLWIYAHGQAE